MKVGLSTTMIQRGKGGIGQYVFALTKALLQERPDIRLHLFVLEEDLPLFEFVNGRAEIITVSEKYRSAIRNILFHQWKIPGHARRLNLDVMHVPSYRRMIWRRPCAMVSTIHDLAPFHVKGKYDFARMFYGRVVVKRIAQRQDRIISISENTATDIERFFNIPVERQQRILNGISHERFNPGNRDTALAQVDRAHGLKNPYFLYISRLEHPAKNHVRLIEAFERFRAATGSNWELVFGGGDWHGAEVVNERIAASSCSDAIRSLGFVKDEELPDLYRAAGCFVFPSLFEGFGLPPAEAMACGCPVISSTRGSLGEVVGNAAEVIDPDDVSDIERKLTLMATDRTARNARIEAGLVNAKRFDWSANARAVADVYETVATGRGSL
jgi:glycosyltransferase involved in cell wall biosynthesis